MKLTLLFVAVVLTSCCIQPAPHAHRYLWEEATPHETETNMLRVIRLEYRNELIN